MGAAAISQQSFTILDDAACETTTLPKSLERRQSIAKATTLPTLPEVDEEDDKNEDHIFNNTRNTHMITITTTTTLPSLPSLPLQLQLNEGRPVLVTRERETVKLDNTHHVNPTVLRQAEKTLRSLLQEIDYEEKQLRYAQKKERIRIERLHRQEKLGIQTSSKEKIPCGAWIHVVSVWEAQNGVVHTDKDLPTTFAVFSPDRIRVITRLVAILLRLDDPVTAQQLWESTLEQCMNNFGPRHPHTLAAISGLANVLLEQNRVLLAEVAARRGLSGLVQSCGNKHPMTRYTRRLLIRIIHKLSELKPHYYEEQERLLREDLQLEQEDLQEEGTMSGGHSLFAHYNLANFCVHFGRYDEATTILRSAVATMSSSMQHATLNPPLRKDMQDVSSQQVLVPGSPPKTPPALKKCEYTLKAMALNTRARIVQRLKDFEKIALQWEDKVRATIEAGHARSASFYQTKVDAARNSMEELHKQEEERRQQEIAREDLIARREILEKHTFATAVLRREKMEYERKQGEAEVARLGAPATESTHLDLLPQAWECINLLKSCLERKFQHRNNSMGTFKDEEINEQKEIETLLEWMEVRQHLRR